MTKNIGVQEIYMYIIYIYIYIYIYIKIFRSGYRKYVRTFRSSYRKLPCMGFEPTTTEFHSDALTN